MGYVEDGDTYVLHTLYMLIATIHFVAIVCVFIAAFMDGWMVYNCYCVELAYYIRMCHIHLPLYFNILFSLLINIYKFVIILYNIVKIYIVHHIFNVDMGLYMSIILELLFIHR